MSFLFYTKRERTLLIRSTDFDFSWLFILDYAFFLSSFFEVHRKHKGIRFDAHSFLYHGYKFESRVLIWVQRAVSSFFSFDARWRCASQKVSKRFGIRVAFGARRRSIDKLLSIEKNETKTKKIHECVVLYDQKYLCIQYVRLLRKKETKRHFSEGIDRRRKTIVREWGKRVIFTYGSKEEYSRDLSIVHSRNDKYGSHR